MLAPNGPAADYPIILGTPYTIGDKSFTPLDTLNYDAVGHASVGKDGGSTISAAHHTLPLPSYVEVTSLASGRTVLVRVERRGPMASTNLIELSPGAASQLGVTDQVDAPVRVRRVNPPEAERALLRSGQQAPLRMDTPMSLVGVLKRKLDRQEGVPAPTPAAAPAPAPSATPAPVLPAKPVSMVTASKSHFAVQVGAFASKANAEATARALGAQVSPSGRLWRVRLEGLATRAEAEAALAKVHAAGYSDARIQRGD